MMQMVRENLTSLCESVRDLAFHGQYTACYTMICEAMAKHPDSPEPHNLLGLILEKTGDHTSAMRHFRAAWALDPSYAPANQNLKTYGTFLGGTQCAYDEKDCVNFK